MEEARAVIIVERKIGSKIILINLKFQVIDVIKWFFLLDETRDVIWERNQNILTALGYDRDYGLKVLMRG
jgi:hypothetical protein